MAEQPDQKPDRNQCTLVVGTVGQFIVAVHGDRLVVHCGKYVLCARVVQGLGAFVAANKGHLRLRHGITPDKDDIFFLFDETGFGYAENLTDPTCSEWGYCE